jgi:midasin (ATPase involved in ribosome maturation)
MKFYKQLPSQIDERLYDQAEGLILDRIAQCIERALYLCSCEGTTVQCVKQGSQQRHPRDFTEVRGRQYRAMQLHESTSFSV